MLPKDSPSTPTRYTISSALDQTPTSKANAPTSAKKSYVLSIFPKPTQDKQISPDPKATLEAKIKGEPPRIESSVVLPSSATQDKRMKKETTTCKPLVSLLVICAGRHQYMKKETTTCKPLVSGNNNMQTLEARPFV